jgi:L-seryl-tRNA(Ser) seleniumtransferase
VELPTSALALGTHDRPPRELDEALRSGLPPVLGRVADDRLLLDCRTVLAEQIPSLATRLAALA